MKNNKRVFALILVLTLVMGTAVYAANSGVVTLTEQPSDDPDYIKIVKENDGKPITDQEAVFKVEYFTNDKCSGSPARTWYYKTIDGYVLLNDKAYYLNSYDGHQSDALFTGAAGLPTLPLGSIRITEAHAPTGYLKSLFQLGGKITQPSNGSAAQFQWTTQADGAISYKADEAHIQNSRIKGSLKIVKRDSHEDKPLSGAGYRILDTQGRTAAEGYTNAQGEVTFDDLPYGDYYYLEFCPPLGYLPDDTRYPFSIRENGLTIEKTQTDARREATIQVKKQDTQGSALSGAVFLLEYSTDGNSWTPVFPRSMDGEVTVGGCTSPGLANGQLTTGADGTAAFTGLRADSATKYRLTETAAPKGMSLLSSPFYVGTLPVKTDRTDAADSQSIGDTVYCYTLYITAADDYVFRLPLTGSAGFAWLPLAMTLAAVPMVFVIKRKEKSE